MQAGKSHNVEESASILQMVPLIAKTDFWTLSHGYDAILSSQQRGEQLQIVFRLYDAADFDGDGNLDILLVDAKKLRVFLNDGVYMTNIFLSRPVEILDVNDDGYFDVFVPGMKMTNIRQSFSTALKGNKLIPPVLNVIKESRITHRVRQQALPGRGGSTCVHGKC